MNESYYIDYLNDESGSLPLRTPLPLAGRLHRKPRHHWRRQQGPRRRRQGQVVTFAPFSLTVLDGLANQDIAAKLRNDLNTDDDSKRTVNSIDVASVNQIFSGFGLKDPECDKNKDGQVNGDELKCLSKIWKNFVPK